MASAAGNKRKQQIVSAPPSGLKKLKVNHQGEIHVAVSLDVMFNMKEEKNDKSSHQNTDQPFRPGAALPFIKAMVMVNRKLQVLDPESQELFKILLMVPSKRHPGTRLTRNIKLNNMSEEDFMICEFESEDQLINELRSRRSKLYLSGNPEQVRELINPRADGEEFGIPAATVFIPDVEMNGGLDESQLRVAFDGDGIIFSDASEKFTQKSLEAFFQHEEENRDEPLPEGPLSGFLMVLMELQAKFRAKNKECLIRTYLVTSRGLGTPGVRVLKSLERWGMKIDEAFFLSGSNKGPVLQAIKPQIFFDDQMRHIRAAGEAGIMGAHVPYGAANQ